MRLLEKEKNGIQKHDPCKPAENSKDITSPEYFKDKSKKWQKFVTQVSVNEIDYDPLSCFLRFANKILVI